MKNTITHRQAIDELLETIGAKHGDGAISDMLYDACQAILHDYETGFEKEDLDSPVDLGETEYTEDGAFIDEEEAP